MQITQDHPYHFTLLQQMAADAHVAIVSMHLALYQIHIKGRARAEVLAEDARSFGGRAGRARRIREVLRTMGGEERRYAVAMLKRMFRDERAKSGLQPRWQDHLARVLDAEAFRQRNNHTTQTIYNYD